MRRRDFITGITLAGAGLSAGAARAEYGDRLVNGATYPVRVISQGQGIGLNRLVLTDGQGAWSLDWRAGAALYFEDRVNLSGVGGIGQLFRTPFRTRWQNARPIGTVEILPGAGTLVARVHGLGDVTGRQATLGVGDYSWDLPGRLQYGGAAPQGAPAGAIRLGDDGRLLISLPQMYPQL